MSGDIVYVNYGRTEDYDYLVGEYGQDFLRDKICMARYGEVRNVGRSASSFFSS